MSTATGTPSQLNAVWAYVDAHQDEMLEQLKTLVRQPSISAQNVGVRECAELLAGMMRADGIETEIVPSAGQPVIIGKGVAVPGAPTILVYGHYDVQPVDPLDAWLSPPFEPTIRDGRLWGRGTGDNKGQLLAQLLAYRAWKEVAGGPPLNITFIFEGEEESGSPHLAQFCRDNRDRLAADMVYLSDGPVHESGKQTISLGVRGVLSIELEAHGTHRDYHSGHGGNLIPNPAWELVHLLASMRAADGRILIEGFEDDVRPVGKAERDAVNALPMDIPAYLEEHGIPQLAPHGETPFFDRIMFHPTVNINGFSSGYSGQGMKTIIPAKAVVKMDLRLVVDQRADDIYEKVVRHVQKHAPNVTVRRGGSMEPSRTPVDDPYVQVVARAVERTLGERPLIFPASGGSLPDYAFTRDLGLPLVKVPYANADEANHAPNENLELSRFYGSIKIAATVYEELANAHAPAR
ncbi:MAG: M20/M25/M40 family metallo-hydrolase [Chloroflexi bacterium]|nr:M20/M25/M40 family metallo-hydrolase [Chloroflexota bacterium]